MIADAETVYPCPFCHGKSYIEISHPKYRVRCDDCSALGPIAYAPDGFTDCSHQAAKLWNAYRECVLPGLMAEERAKIREEVLREAAEKLRGTSKFLRSPRCIIGTDVHVANVLDAHADAILALTRLEEWKGED